MRRFILLVNFYLAVLTASGQKRTSGTLPQTQAYAGGELDTCLNKQFSLVFYVFQDQNTTRTTASGGPWKDSLLNVLNRAFSPICVSFANCSTVVVPYWQTNVWKWPMSDQMVIPSWYTENTINVYIPDDVVDTYAQEDKGYAYASGVYGAYNKPYDAVVIAGDTLNPLTNLTHAIHIFGHFMGLHDTFSEIGPAATPSPTHGAITSHEFVDGSNCATNGDGLCDTEADCFPVDYATPAAQLPGKTYYCFFGREVKDGKGRYYTPPIDNYMSRYACRCRFTRQQYNKMARYIRQHRWHLH